VPRLARVQKVRNQEEQYRGRQDRQYGEKADLPHTLHVPEFPPLLKKGKEHPDLKEDMEPVKPHRVSGPEKVRPAREDLRQPESDDDGYEDHEELKKPHVSDLCRKPST
jgi:hypothetical protein